METVKVLSYDSHHYHTHPSNHSLTPTCPIDGVIVVLEEAISIRIEMFHHRIKVTTQNDFVLICVDLYLLVDPNHDSKMTPTA